MTEYSESVNDIVSRLPPWMPKNKNSGNYNLIGPVGEKVDQIRSKREKMQSATRVTEADSVPQLKERGKIVSLPSKTGEEIERYRTRVLIEHKLLTNETTTQELLKNVSSLLDIEPEKIIYNKQDHGYIRLTIPGQSLNSLSVNASEFEDITEKLVAAGFLLEILALGTFVYATPDDYNNGNYDSSVGYAGLDANGEITEGGKYTGFI